MIRIHKKTKTHKIIYEKMYKFTNLCLYWKTLWFNI